MIPRRIIGIDINLDLISPSGYERLMISMRFIGINMNIKGIYRNELD
jgi:hypothetical protein